MRTSFFIGSIALGAAAAVACAATGASEAPGPDAGPNVPPIPEGGSTEVDAGTDAPFGPQTCSAAGWCVTTLPDRYLSIMDVWPLAGRTFAVATSPMLGVKFLEWVDADAKWTYIDDNTQNEEGRGRWVGKMWAPSENEVYFGVSPNYVFHGTRTAPGTPWSWVHHSLGTADQANPNDGRPQYFKRDVEAQPTPALGIWGTSSGDVYAWFKNRIYHWVSVDGGAPEWAPEYALSDPDVPWEQMYFFAAAGTSPDEVWFSGARSKEEWPSAGCALLVRRTAGGFEKITDGVIVQKDIYGLEYGCEERPGSLFIGGAQGWLTDLHAVSSTELIGLKGARDVVKISVEAGSYSVASAPIPSRVSQYGFNSLSLVADSLWLGGIGVVVRGDGVWNGGAYALSSTSLSGAPLASSLYQVRGTSNTNLWAVGSLYALHKTTP